MSVRLPLLLLGLAAACAHAGPPIGAAPAPVVEVQVGTARFRVEDAAPDGRGGRDVLAALPGAAARAQRWGALREPVTITVHASHAALEEAAQRPGHAWLRGWARYDTIEVQSPRTWSSFGASPQDVEAFLAHELTHCAMYQAAGSAGTWQVLGIPLWFREGMASVTADPREARVAPERLATFLRTGAGDPLVDPEPLYRTQSDLVYGTAHLAFRFLLERYGEERIRAVLAGLAAGQEFERAFAAGVGLTLPEFERDFRRYVSWGGWARAD